MKKTCLFLSLLLMGFSTVVVAAEPPGLPGIQQGEKEVSGNIAVMNNSGGDFDSTNYMVLGSFGYFLTDQVQVKGSGLVFGTTGDADMLMGSVLVGADYLFLANLDVTPYAGGDVGVSYSKFDIGDGSSSDTGVGLDVHVGLKQFVSDNTALNYELRYQMDTADTSARLIMFLVGLNIYLQ